MIRTLRLSCFCITGLLCMATGGFAQSVGIGTLSPDASAQLDISNTSKGILVPRMSSVQRSAIASPATGLLVFQTDGMPGFYYYSGMAWVNLTTGNQVSSLGFSASYGTATTVAGSGPAGSTDGTASTASFNAPYDVAVDASGNLYVADYYSHKIRKISAGGMVSTLAGSGVWGNADGTGAAATFATPSGIAVDAAGTIYVADRGNNNIRKITPQGVVSTFAGNGLAQSINGTGTAASFHMPIGIAVDIAGNVYVCEFGGCRVRKITPAAVVTTLAGSGSMGSADGTGGAASFFVPAGLTVDISGNVYVADGQNNKIRKITPQGVVTTLAGSGGAGSADGTGSAASFSNPQDVTADALGNIYVADYQNNKIRKITAQGVVTTLAGNGVLASMDANGTSASFGYPQGIAVDAAGNLYIAEFYGNKIRKVIAW